MSDPTPTLAEFLPRYKADDNEWWRLGSGHHQNLFDEAVEKLAALRKAAEATVRAFVEYDNAVEFKGGGNIVFLAKAVHALRVALEGEAK